jgi:hypothetical protein
MNKNNKRCGFVVPYVHGGTSKDNGQPVLLVPEGQAGPVDKKHNQPLVKAERAPDGKARDWFYVGTFTIGQDRWDAYGAHHGPSSGAARKMLEEELGDALAQASADDAVSMVANEANRFLNDMIKKLISAQPELASAPRKELEARVKAMLLA